MSGPWNDPLSWLATVVIAGALGALASRPLRLPAATGALAGGWIVGAALPAPPTSPIVWLAGSLASAWLCFLLGAEMELGRILRARGALVRAGIVTAGLVLAMAAGAAWVAGTPPLLALLAGACCAAGSPVALAAVSSEARARGVMTQRLGALAGGTLALSVLLAAAAAWAADGGARAAIDLAVSLGFGAACGAVALMPLSRTASRAAILPSAGLACLMLVATSTWNAFPGTWLVPMSLAAGLVTGTLAPRAGQVREAMRDAALPCAVILFAVTGASWEAPLTTGLVLAAASIVCARAAALALAATLARDGEHGIHESLAQIPSSAALVAAPALGALAAGAGDDLARLAGTLALVTLLSEGAGMAALRWSLARSREGMPLQEDPDAWRAGMR